MAKPSRLYSRLTRAAPGIASYTSLWLASDHVLQVNSAGYHESYQRFYLRDIQGFLISPSSRGLYLNIIAGAACAISGVPLVYLLATGRSPALAPFLLVPALLVLVINLVKGRTCRVDVITAVQTVRLRSLRRRRRTDTVLRRLQPLITAAQADLAPAAPPAPASPAAEPPPVPPGERAASPAA